MAPGGTPPTSLTKEQVAKKRELEEMLHDFVVATSYGRSPTLAGVAQVMRGRGLIIMLATGEVITQINDSSNKKGPIERKVACVRGQDGTFIVGCAGLADEGHTVGLPLSFEELALQNREELKALEMMAMGSPLSARTRLERIQSVRAFEELFRHYLISKFGAYSPHSGSKKNSQWTDWLEANVARIVYRNLAMLGPEVVGKTSLSGLVEGFENVFNHTLNAKLSSTFGGKPNPATKMPDVLAVLGVSCLTCYSRDGCEGICLVCHNKGTGQFPAGFLASVDSPRGNDNVPDDPAFKAFCSDQAMVNQFQLANKSLASKMAAYRNQYPGRQVTMKKTATVAKVVPVARDTYLARFQVMQGFMGVSGLKGEPSIRPYTSS
jgi:hypothetical protein